MRKLIYVALATSIYIIACTKIESTNIGGGILPPIDNVNTFDTTLEVITNTFVDPLADSQRVYKADDQVIGTINNDPTFGKTTATSFFELKPTFFKYSLQGKIAERMTDSVVLVLSYKGTFGDNNVAQTWEVRELDEKLKGDSNYSVRTKFNTKGTLLGSATLSPAKFGDSIITPLEQAKDQIRITLSGAFGDRLIRQYDSIPSGLGAYESDSLFRENFKGFAVMPAAGSSGNALIRVNLLDTNTKLAIYYSYKSTDTSTIRTHTVNRFRFATGANPNVARSGSGNYIKRDYTGSELARNINNPANDSAVYIQTSPGTYATIKIPKLDSFPNSIIHRAELIAVQFPEQGGAHQIFAVPQYLLLSHFDNAGNRKRNIPNDFFVVQGVPNTVNFGGYPIDKSIDPFGIVKSYNFDLSRYVQGIFTRKDTSFTLHLSAPANDSLWYTPPYPTTASPYTYYFSTSATNPAATGRVRIGGGGMAPGNQLRMRLRIIYSKI